jgi:hypothetical protein
MVLCAHLDAGLLNETTSHSRARAHIFLSENKPFLRFNGAVLSIAQIIKFVMASAAGSELAALFVTAREMIPHRQSFISMGWPQPKSPIQTDNSTTAGFINKTIVPRRAKMMDMRYCWLPCRTSQDKFCYYWDAGSKNCADYHTKHHSDTYHEAHLSTHAGIWDPVPFRQSCLATGLLFSLFRFTLFTFSFLPIIIPALGILLQGCVDPQIPWMGRPS